MTPKMENKAQQALRIFEEEAHKSIAFKNNYTPAWFSDGVKDLQSALTARQVERTGEKLSDITLQEALDNSHKILCGTALERIYLNKIIDTIYKVLASQPANLSTPLDPDMKADELRLHMGELTAAELLMARAAIRWANSTFQPGVEVRDACEEERRG